MTEEKLKKILKELQETKEIVKGKVYVEGQSEAPKGAKLQRGPKGGTYYEEGAAKPMVTPEFENKLAQAAAGKYELSDTEYATAKGVYDKLARVTDISKHPPQHNKIWDYLVKIFD